ncbi:MAG: twin-arginine translocase TatA/TatE family subunit [Bacteroidetes bacterium]|nr:twin-arginine translocase TatA/TatE family subunit [Bacteroidota bacterium]
MNNPYIFLGAIGTQEVIGIIIVVLILFGGRKIPELMRGLGKGIREFNDAKNNVRREIEEGASEPENKNP